MNVYDSFFAGISADDWEFFASDFLFYIGYEKLTSPAKGTDGGVDFLVKKDNIRYLVSCKHYLKSGYAVGTDKEQSILDRLCQHNATGFIGFYSTFSTNPLISRLNSLKDNNKMDDYIIYGKSEISNHLPNISSWILQKYGLPKGVRFVLNVDEYEYTPLNCLGCGEDILHDDMINWSIACICLNNTDELEYIYGCKTCLQNIPDVYWIEVSQSLHLEQLNGWIQLVDKELKTVKPSTTFYQNRSNYERTILQRLYPSNWGKWSNVIV